MFPRNCTRDLNINNDENSLVISYWKVRKNYYYLIYYILHTLKQDILYLLVGLLKGTIDFLKFNCKNMKLLSYSTDKCLIF